MLNTEKREATLSNVNLRIQKHGDQRVPAADLKFTFQLPSAELDAIEPGLKETLYRKPKTGDQMEIAAGPEGWTVLRHPGLEPVRLKGKFPGYEIILTTTAFSHVSLPMTDVELQKITLDAYEGGTVAITVTASMPVDDEDVASITAFLREGDVLLTLTPPASNLVAPPATASEDAGASSASVH